MIQSGKMNTTVSEIAENTKLIVTPQISIITTGSSLSR